MPTKRIGASLDMTANASNPLTTSADQVMLPESRPFIQRKFSATPANHRLSDIELSHDPVIRQKQMSVLKCQRRKSFEMTHINTGITVPDIMHLELISGETVPWWTSQRLLLSIITFLGFILVYAHRVNLSIAIVSMVDHSSATKILPTGNGSYSPTSNETDISVNLKSAELCPELTKSQNAGEFKWSKDLTGLILGAFFWGYMVLQIPAGQIGVKVGAKKVIAYSMFPVSILTLLSPVSARTSPYLFIVVRILIGLGEGAVYPAVQVLWSRWAPPNERARLIGFSYAGGQFGNAITYPVSGLLCAYGFDGGWPSVFYLIGTLGFLWCVAWMLFAYDTPEENPRCSEIERRYIRYSIGDRMKIRKGSATPWLAMLTSSAFWAIIVAHTCGNYGAYMLLTQIPSYMKEVLKFDIKANGLISMIPYLLFWFCIGLSGMIADYAIAKNILTTAWTRKIMTIIGMVGPGAFLVGTSFMECNQKIEAVVLLTIAVGLCGFHFSGYFINHGDIAPAYAGTLFGISNCIATIPGIVAPYVVAELTPDRTRLQWQSAFYVATGVYVFGAIFYFILGEGEVQEWAEFQDTEGLFNLKEDGKQKK